MSNDAEKTSATSAVSSDAKRIFAATLPFTYPCYLHPSYMQASILVPHVLTKMENYTMWSYAMKMALRGCQKLGFIDGGYKKESFDRSLHDQWDHYNAMVLSWLIRSIFKELSNGIIFF